MNMRRAFSICAAVAASSLFLSHPVRAQDNTNFLKGRYGFTLAETCVQQTLGSPVPGFKPDFSIAVAQGAITYGGASDGQLVFDGKGGVTLQDGRATNIMNAPGFLVQGAVPFGLGFGPSLNFSCVGNYALSGGKVSVNLTCTAAVNPNVFPPVTGFSSTFNMTGWVPQNPDHLLLTDIGNAIQTVTILSGTTPLFTQQRVCTRSTTAVLVSPN
jgi:hypothetical protein